MLLCIILSHIICLMAHSLRRHLPVLDEREHALRGAALLDQRSHCRKLLRIGRTAPRGFDLRIIRHLIAKRARRRCQVGVPSATSADLKSSIGKVVISTIELRSHTNRHEDESGADAEFKSPRHAQRFLSSHSRIHNRFQLRCHLLSSQDYRSARSDAFATWRRVADTN